jgi:spore coat polysaccharide biosynthesis predicted glycosyltransferase SpsG
MMRADLAIGAAGSALLERAFLGVPTIVKVIASNQVEAAKALNSVGAIILWSEKIKLEDVIVELILNPQQLKNMSKICLNMMSYRGSYEGIKLIVERILQV